MASYDRDFERLKRMLKAPAPHRKFVLCQIAVTAVVIYFWYSFNEGFTPWFLRKIPVLHVGSDVSPMVYFPHANEDGNNIEWARHVNSKQALQDAIAGDVDMIQGDVLLKGQDTDHQYLTPLMGRLPDSKSDLTLDLWLQEIMLAYHKGIKISFQSNDAVEITLQKLKDSKRGLMRPVWLHADILQGPHGSKPRVDMIRYFKHVKRLFPECTMSLGWTTGTHTDLSLSGYSWDGVLDMYHAIMDAELEQPIVISVRSSLIRNSVPQIKWLTDNTKASVFIWQEEGERTAPENLMHIAYRFAPEKSYWDIHDKNLKAHLKKNRNKSSSNLSPYAKKRDTVLFRPEAWLKMGLYMEHHSVLPSEEALVLQSRAVYVITKTKYKPSDLTSLNGRVQFLNRKKRDVVPNETGLSIYVRSTAYTDFENIVGIQCFLGLDGQMKIMSSHLNTEFQKSMRFTPGTSNCFRFSVVDTQTAIVFRVMILHDCHTLESVMPMNAAKAELKLEVPRTIGNEMNPFIVKLEDSNRVAVFDELHVKHGGYL
ncbi:uncharacterized protein LOC133200736 [Saccostrea echinata]|uniref:uncharacterized protein LOC133200736 n=1 Tax=Saccostrea echinata TaxID=191078 RepID=UPI002A81314C|nr:uncharacterized protein LOC133200736 [Saccostrea echinata]